MSDSHKTYWSDKETHTGQSLTFASHSLEQETSFFMSWDKKWEIKAALCLQNISLLGISGLV